jgi:putative tricarboxylic transport membrane protein
MNLSKEETFMKKTRHCLLSRKHPAWLLAALAQLCLVLPAHAQASAWTPSRNVELVVGSGVGGPLDLGARTIQKIWHDSKMVEVSTTVVNKPGAGGLLGFIHLNQHTGDGHHLAITSPTLISNHIVGASPVGYMHLTPVAVLFNEYVSMGVRTDSGMKTVKEMIATLKSAPESISISIAAALGNHNHIGIAMATRQAGGDVRKLKIVVNKSSGESATVLLGGHVDMATATVSNFIPHLKTGKLRILAVAAPKRLDGELSSIPTFTENGHNVIVGG